MIVPVQEIQRTEKPPDDVGLLALASAVATVGHGEGTHPDELSVGSAFVYAAHPTAPSVVSGDVFTEEASEDSER